MSLHPWSGGLVLTIPIPERGWSYLVAVCGLLKVDVVGSEGARNLENIWFVDYRLL